MRAWAFLFAVCVVMSSAWAQDLVEPDFREIREHQIEGPPTLHMPWRDGASTLAEQSYTAMWGVRITVDETGAMTDSAVRYGPDTQREEVIAAAQLMSFRPFERNGRPVPAEFDVSISAVPADYVGPEERGFPEHVDLATVRIRFERHGCFGTCPAYSLDVRGDGAVTYVGHDFVLAVGELHWRIPQENVEAIIALMRRADFFRLGGHYELNASDLPTYITGLEIGDQRKYVLDYGGRGILGEGTIASVSMGPDTGLPMPEVVTEIEQMIDRLSGVEPYVHGDETSIERLRAAGFDFRAEPGGAALGFSLSNCNLPLARALLAHGAPITTRDGDIREPQPVVLYVARCGDVDLAQDFVARGALRERHTAARFLRASAVSGFPEMVRFALRHSRAVNAREDGGDPPLAEAVGAIDPHEFELDLTPRARFDVGETVELLLRAGANARYRDGLMGWTPLHSANDARAIRALIAAGANPSARDNEGQTPLFGAYDPAAAQVLIEAGASVNVRDHNRRTALHEAGSAGVVSVLVAAGADIEARDAQDRTPLETVQGEDAARALLRAGAQMPNDPAKVAALVRGARRRGWTELAPQFEAHARNLGVTVDEQ